MTRAHRLGARIAAAWPTVRSIVRVLEQVSRVAVPVFRVTFWILVVGFLLWIAAILLEEIPGVVSDVRSMQRWVLVASAGEGKPVKLREFNSIEACEEALQREGRELYARGAAIGLRCVTVYPWWRLVLHASQRRR